MTGMSVSFVLGYSLSYGCSPVFFIITHTDF